MLFFYYNSLEDTNIYIRKGIVEFMEKDIDRIMKNPDTDIVIRIDDFGGKRGLTIREFVKSERYTGFTKAGTRIPADKFKVFKEAINSIDEKDLDEGQVTLDKGEKKKVSSGQSADGEKKKSDWKKWSDVKKVEGIEEQAM